MTNSNALTTSLVNDYSIDRDRIVDDRLVPDEYFCPICQDLLWKPRSCASCQHLFCEKWIQKWIQNPISANKCPFRCQSYEDRRCPPYVHSLLSRLNIRCRNASFGCTQILSYDLLEQHENVECEYLSERCSECEQLVLVSRLNEHYETTGLCLPRPVRCTFCENYVEKPIFADHFHRCFKNKMDLLLEQQSAVTNVHPIVNGTNIINNWLNVQNLLEQQRQITPVPTKLIGAEAVRRAREQRCGFFHHIFLMLTFILANGSKAPFFILLFSLIGLLSFVQIMLTLCFIIILRISNSLYRGVCQIMVLSYIITHITPLFLRMRSDLTMIYFFGIFVFLLGCCNRTPLEMFEMNPAMTMPPIVNFLFYCAGLLAMKLLLLLCRFYYWIIPTYLTAGIFAWISFFIVFWLKQSSRNATTPHTT